MPQRAEPPRVGVPARLESGELPRLGLDQDPAEREQHAREQPGYAVAISPRGDEAEPERGDPGPRRRRRPAERLAPGEPGPGLLARVGVELEDDVGEGRALAVVDDPRAVLDREVRHGAVDDGRAVQLVRIAARAAPEATQRVVGEAPAVRHRRPEEIAHAWGP